MTPIEYESTGAGFESVELNIGQVSTPEGHIGISLHLDGQGNGHITVFAHARGTRHSGELIPLPPDEWSKLVALVEKTNATIRRLQSTGQLRKLPR